ncbi:MAG: PadR family transcriptional regulator [Sneathiella sp.]
MDVRTLCLGILTFGDSSGYEIKKAFEGRLSLAYDAGFGSIYPALNKLTKEEFVSCRAEAQSKRPDKKVYSITKTGRAFFIEQIKKTPAADKYRSEALTTLMFSHMLPASNITSVVDELIKSYDQNIKSLAEGCDMKQSQSEKFLCGFGVTVRQAAIDYMQENRHLIETETLPEQRTAS